MKSHSMNAHGLEVTSTYIILLLPAFMLQVISVAWGGCIMRGSGVIQIGVESTHGMIPCLLKLMLNALACMEWLSGVFFCFSHSHFVNRITHVHLYIGLFLLEMNQMMRLVCGLYGLNLRATGTVLLLFILIASLVVPTSFPS